MIHSLHCTTFWRDIHYYKGMLCSLRSFARGWTEYVLVVPDADKDRFAKLHQNFDIGMPWRIESRPEIEGHGHPQHWVDQMEADKRTYADYITHIDSDCVFTEVAHASETLDPSGRAYVTLEPWGRIHPARQVWRAETEKVLRISTPGETMCGFPATYHRSMYASLRDRITRITGMQPLQFALTKPKEFPYGGFSEFVTMGNWAIYAHPDTHVSIEPGEFKLLAKLNQFWSHRQVNEVLDPNSKRNLIPLLKDREDLTADYVYRFLFTLTYDQINQIQL